ncbi:ABC transporter permease subunit [Micromonospora coerulea]|uniref:ABC transporter permease subunit n=1 Tax=Micromonospora coerulea TaxID=47856 RepID=UPI001907C376|nr:ABC transporter permease subunit [Micromonospora veneta]
MTARESFPRLLLAEWTKLRSVSRWAITLIGAAVLTIGLSYLAASGNKWDPRAQAEFVTGPLGKPVADNFYYVHQQITGDTTLTVRVASLTPAQNRRAVQMGSDQMTKVDDPSPFAQPAAGIMIKDGTTPGSSYASVMLTAAQGVRMQWDFDADRKGSASTGTRWLRLVRSGPTITGYESADGAQWQKIATATPKNLPSTVAVGFYVSSPSAFYTTRGGGSSSLGEHPTRADATFDNVLGSGATWHGDAVGKVVPTGKGGAPEGQFTEANGTFTVKGTGKVGPKQPDDDMVEAALIGVIAGLMALIAVGVLYATSEYHRGMIRTTFAATPRRGRVLAAKAIVLGTTSFLVGLVGAVGSFVLAIPILRKQGFTTPAFPRPSLMDGSVLRALLLTAAFMAGVTVVGLAIGVLLRHSAAAITITIVLVLGPLIVGMILPGTSPKWLMYTTLAGGMATQRAKPPTITLAEPWAMIGPWAGIGVVAAWAIVTLGLAWWQLRRRDA